eukprot:12880701-Prorocentrum_lima.AAC.1
MFDFDELEKSEAAYVKVEKSVFDEETLAKATCISAARKRSPGTSRLRRIKRKMAMQRAQDNYHSLQADA